MAIDIRARLVADTSRFGAALRNAGAQMRAAFTGAKGKGLGVGDAMGAMGVPVGALGAIAAVGMALRKAGNDAERFQDAAGRWGGSATFMGELSDRAELTGQSLEAVESAIGRSNKAIQGARDGNEKAANALKVLGLSAEQMSGTPVSNWVTLSRALASAGGDSAKLVAAQALMGKGAAALLPMMKDADKFGEKTTAGALRFDFVMGQLAQSGDVLAEAWGAFVSLVGLLVSPVAFILNTLAAVVKSIGAAASAWADADGIVAGGKAAAAAFQEAFTEEMEAGEIKQAAKAEAAKAAGLGGVDEAFDDDGEEMGRGKKGKKAAAKAGGGRGAGGGVGLTIGRNVAGMEALQQRHQARMEALAGQALEAAKETAAHTKALKGV